MGLLKSTGVDAEFLNSQTSSDDYRRIMGALRGGRVIILFITPEKFANSDSMRAMLKDMYAAGQLARFVIDEAHCVSNWGHGAAFSYCYDFFPRHVPEPSAQFVHRMGLAVFFSLGFRPDFRPDYLRLAQLKADFPQTSILALTATATPSVQDDVMRQLRMRDCVRFQQSFNRTNLRYTVLRKGAKCHADIAALINSEFVLQCGIVYCNSKQDCENMAQRLCEQGIQADYYHAGLDAAKREDRQNAWSNDEFPVICATIAFGMGAHR